MTSGSTLDLGPDNAYLRQIAGYLWLMTDDDRMEALLDIVDPTRAESRAKSETLAVLGYVERRGRNGFWPTNAGWNFLGDRGRAFDMS